MVRLLSILPLIVLGPAVAICVLQDPLTWIILGMTVDQRSPYAYEQVPEVLLGGAVLVCCVGVICGITALGLSGYALIRRKPVTKWAGVAALAFCAGLLVGVRILGSTGRAA